MTTPEQIQAFIGLGTMIGFVAIGVMNRLDARKAIKAAEASAEAAKLSAQTGNAIHKLVNSAMGSSLRTNMLQAKRIAAFSKGTPNGAVDENAAIEAERLYNEHVAKQAAVDADASSNQI